MSRFLASIITCILLILVIVPPVLADHPPTIRIRTYNTDDGLTSHNISQIIQDRAGYMWIATDDGVNRFDGKRFGVYRNEPGDTTTISDSRVTVLLDTEYHQEQVLWVGTRNGLNRVDLETGLSNMYLHDPDNENSLSHPIVTALAIDTDGSLWVGTENGLNVLSIGGQSVKYFKQIRFDTNNDRTLSSNFIRSISIGPGYGPNKTLWVGTRNGLKRIRYASPEDYSIENFDFPHSQTNPNHNEVRSLIIHEEKENLLLYVGTDGGSLYSLDLLTMDPDPKEVWRFDHFLRDVVIDDYQQIWAATYGGGLSRLTPTSDGRYEEVRFLGNPALKNSLSNSHTTDICLDASGILWVGTDNGVNLVLQPSPGFHVLDHDPEDPNTLISSGIRSILEDSQGRLWVGTVASGLTRISNGGQTYTHFRHDPERPGSLSSNSITSFLEDHYGNLWMGTWDGGLVRYNEAGETFTAYRSDPLNPNSPPDNVIQGLLEDRSGNLWLNTGNGLSRFDPIRETFINYLHDPADSNSVSEGDLQSLAMYLDDRNRLWVGSYGGGLNRLDLDIPGNMDPETAVFKHYRSQQGNPASLSNDMIICLAGSQMGSREVLWAGTFNGGFNRLLLDEASDGDSPLITRYSELDGLSDNVVFGIEKDSRGQLWLSTGSGLSHFDPYLETFQNYYIEDGLPSNAFFWGASYVSAAGEIYFGGTDGLVHFKPETIVGLNSQAPGLTITGMTTENGPVAKAPMDLNRTYHVFDHDDGPFSIQWALFDYTKPEKNQYWYRIDELHDQWVFAGNATEATFGNLEQGKLTFRVKAKSYNGTQALDEGVLFLRIWPPFHKTLLFKVIIFFLVGGLIYLMIAIRTQVVANANKQLVGINRELNVTVSEKAAAEEQIKASLQEKEALLREIYHRTKNNMAVILSLLDLQAAKMKEPGVQDIFDEIKGRIFAMSLVHEQLMRSQDLSAINLNTYIHQLVANLIMSFGKLDNRVTPLMSVEPIHVSIDTAVPLGLVLNEILTNSLKHAFPNGRKGELNISARMTEDKLFVSVHDNGVGFDPVSNDFESSSLGLGIIRTIIEDQLDGQLEMDHTDGTTYNITIGEVQIVRRV